MLAEADREAKAILGEATKEAEAIAQRRAKETQVRIEALRREILGASEFEARRKLLAVKRELSEEFRRRVLARLAQLPEERNRKLLEKLASTAKKEIPKGKVHARKKDLDPLTATGYDAGDSVSGSGGFIVESASGDVLLDYRFDVLLDEAWKQILAENQELFEVS